MNLWTNQQLDRGLPRRVTRASLVFAVILFLFLLSWRLENWAYSYLLGASLGIYSFEVFRMGVRAFLRTSEMKEEDPIATWKKVVTGLLFVLKLPIWLVTIYAAAVDAGLPLFAFVGGIATPQFVMVSKVASRKLVGDTREEESNNDSVHRSVEQSTRSVAQ